MRDNRHVGRRYHVWTEGLLRAQIDPPLRDLYESLCSLRRGYSQVVEIEEDIAQVDWASFHTAYGDAKGVPTLLRTLASSELEDAMDASHKIWCGLCHQHAYISSASLPSYPILLKILRSSKDELVVEILDIMWGFAKCSAEGFFGSPQKLQWVVDLRSLMKKDRVLFEELAKSSDEGIRDFARWISEELGKPK